MYSRVTGSVISDVNCYKINCSNEMNNIFWKCIEKQFNMHDCSFCISLRGSYVRQPMCLFYSDHMILIQYTCVKPVM